MDQVPSIPWPVRTPRSPEAALRRLEHILSVAKFADGINEGVRQEAELCLTAVWEKVLKG